MALKANAFVNYFRKVPLLFVHFIHKTNFFPWSTKIKHRLRSLESREKVKNYIRKYKLSTCNNCIIIFMINDCYSQYLTLNVPSNKGYMSAVRIECRPASGVVN